MRLRVVLLALLAALAAGCGGHTAATPVVVDTDMSTDDIVALLYVASSPAFDLRAVAVSGTGLTTCPAGARNALQLLALAGRGDVPVACGRSEPLAGANQFPVEWRSRADAFFGLELPPAARAPRAGAVDLMARAIERSSRAVTLLSLAPLTDTAELLRTRPDAAKKLARIVAMGGAVRVPGNVGPGHEHAEFNVWIDPAAAALVIRSGVPVTLVPLDATNDVPVTVFFSDALRRFHYATPAATGAWELFVQNPSVWSGGQYFWDPLAAAAVVKPGLLSYVQEKLRVEPSGRTVAGRSGASVQVARHANRRAFEHELLSTLLDGAPFSIAKPVTGATLAFDGDRCTYDGPLNGAAGSVAFDTVNRSGRAFRYVVLDPTGASPTTPELTGATPPHSRMTWVGFLTSGTKKLVCEAGATRTTAATVTVTGAR
jgi:inosine-uridine nucleoside N-ribohydrolase